MKLHVVVFLWMRAWSRLVGAFSVHLRIGSHTTTHHEKPPSFCGEQGQRLLDDVWCEQRKTTRRCSRARAPAVSSWRMRSCCEVCMLGWEGEG